MHGAKIWDCVRKVENGDQVQLKLSIPHVFGGKYLTSQDIPIYYGNGHVANRIWEVKMSCIQVWYEVLTTKVCDGCLLQKIAMQAMQYGTGSWL